MVAGIKIRQLKAFFQISGRDDWRPRLTTYAGRPAVGVWLHDYETLYVIIKGIWWTVDVQPDTENYVFVRVSNLESTDVPVKDPPQLLGLFAVSLLLEEQRVIAYGSPEATEEMGFNVSKDWTDVPGVKEMVNDAKNELVFLMQWVDLLSEHMKSKTVREIAASVHMQHYQLIKRAEEDAAAARD